jgi:hypothetical protein
MCFIHTWHDTILTEYRRTSALASYVYDQDLSMLLRSQTRTQMTIDYFLLRRA